MNISRRQFLALTAALSASSCARVKQVTTKIEKIDLNLLNTGPDTFTIATMNDLHLLNAVSASYPARVIHQINDDSRIQLTVVLGDLATSAKLGELKMAKDLLDKLDKPYRVVPGNHDVDPREASPLKNYEKCFGDPHWKLEMGDWVFLGMNSCDGTKSDVAISTPELDWLTDTLEGVNAKRPVGLFLHHPLNPNSKAYRVQNADDVLERFAKHNLKFAAAGHYHGNQEEVANGVLFTTTACCSTTRPNFDDSPAKGYRMIHIDKQNVRTEFIEMAV